MTVDWMRFVPDLDGLARRFPVPLILLLLTTTLMLTFADGDLLGPARTTFVDVPMVREIFAFSVAAILSALAIDLYGEARGWSTARQTVGGAIAVLVLCGLYALPMVSPVAAAWLPINPWLQAIGAGLLTLAAMAGGVGGDDGNRRILMAVAGLIGAFVAVSVVLWLLRLPFGAQPGNIPPVAQVLTAAFVMLLSLSWLATRRRLDDGRETLSAAGPAWTLLNWLVLPIFILIATLAIGSMLQAYLIRGSWSMTQNIPVIVAPFGTALAALTLGYVYAAPRRAEDRFSAWYATLWPILASLVAAVVVAGLVREIEAARVGMTTIATPSFQPLGGLHIADQVSRWVFGVVVLVVAVLALAWPSRRDLRLPLTIAGWVFILLGVGPWSLDRLTSARLAPELTAYLTAKGALQNGRLKDADALRWQPLEANTVRGMLSRLVTSDSLGAIEPLFRGATQNPFAHIPKLPRTLAVDVHHRLGVTAPTFRRAVTPTVPQPNAPVPPRAISFGLSAQSSALPLGGFDTLIGPLRASTGPAQQLPQVGIPPSQPRAPQRSVQRVPMPQSEIAGSRVGAFDVQSEMDSEGIIRVRFWEAREEARFDLSPLIKRLRAAEEVRQEFQTKFRAGDRTAVAPPPPQPDEPAVIAALPGGLVARLVVSTLRITEIDGRHQTGDATFWLQVNRAAIDKP